MHILTPLLPTEKEVIWEKINHKSDLFIEEEEEDKINQGNDNYSLDTVAYLNHIKEENCKFLAQSNHIISQLDTLLAIHSSVTSQTQDFQSESNTLIDNLHFLQELYSSLVDKFKLFNNLDSIVKKLNTANNSKLVLKPSFSQLLQDLDTSIEFINDPQHANYKDISVYKSRFNQCLVRALSLIRNYITSYIRSIESKNKEQLVNAKPITIDAIINVNFVNDLSHITNLFTQLYIRSTDHASLLEDVYNQYFHSRQSLLSQFIINPHINSVSFNEDLLTLSTTQIKYFSKLVDKEFEIFKSIFFSPLIDNSINATVLQPHLESLLDPLYYLLRNKILRESSIDKLSQLITFLIDEPPIFLPILQDAQSRLLFQLQKNEPKPYSRTGKELIITSNSNKNKIYPPIETSISVLETVNGLLPKPVFDDITASFIDAILKSFPHASPSDLQWSLYILHSLLELQKHVNSWEILYLNRDTQIEWHVTRPWSVKHEFNDCRLKLQLKIDELIQSFAQQVDDNDVRRTWTLCKESVGSEHAAKLMDFIAKVKGSDWRDEMMHILQTENETDAENVDEEIEVSDLDD